MSEISVHHDGEAMAETRKQRKRRREERQREGRNREERGG
jgi:hypothetical protein